LLAVGLDYPRETPGHPIGGVGGFPEEHGASSSTNASEDLVCVERPSPGLVLGRCAAEQQADIAAWAKEGGVYPERTVIRVDPQTVAGNGG